MESWQADVAGYPHISTLPRLVIRTSSGPTEHLWIRQHFPLLWPCPSTLRLRGSCRADIDRVTTHTHAHLSVFSPSSIAAPASPGIYPSSSTTRHHLLSLSRPASVTIHANQLVWQSASAIVRSPICCRPVDSICRCSLARALPESQYGTQPYSVRDGPPSSLRVRQWRCPEPRVALRPENSLVRVSVHPISSSAPPTFRHPPGSAADSSASK